MVNDHVLIQKEEGETKLQSGIFIPAGYGSDKNAAVGLVFTIGKSSIEYFKDVHGVELHEGSRVTYSKYAGEDLEFRPNREKGDTVKVRDIHHDSISSIIED